MTKPDDDGDLLYQKTAEERVSFWASSVDAFFQEFIAMARNDDRLGTIVASARLAQLGQCLKEEYQETASELCESDTELRAAQQAARLVTKMANDNAEQCSKSIGRRPEPRLVSKVSN